MKKMIYVPKGRALEYSQLACDLIEGCEHKCKYCYCPKTSGVSPEDWASDLKIRDGLVDSFKKEAVKHRGEEKEILFSFKSDMYQSEETASLMGEILPICEENKLKIQVLTKAGFRLAKHFHYFVRNNWKFGSTIIFVSEKLREQWEPGAPSIQSRMDAVKKASDLGIFTWVSIEPVVDTEEAFEVMIALKPYVSLWKVGKLNHFPEIESKIDWKRFLMETKNILNGRNYYIKKDLAEFEI